MKIRIQQAAALHEKGGRFKNEDFVYPLIDPEQVDNTIVESIPNVPGLYMVCDGVGGEQKGEVASMLAAAQFARYFDTFPPNGKVTYGYLSAALIRVEEAFSNHIKSHPESRGMGTTLALLHLSDHGAMMAWVGDSRIYHFRKGEILYKTRDHSLVNDLIEQGEITEEAARFHPQRNVVLRVIKGTEEATDLDTHFIPMEEIEEGDFFMLCSDGILEEVTDSELKTLMSGEHSPESIRQEIYTLCSASSTDNFSMYLTQVEVADKASAGVASQAGLIQEIEGEEDDLILVDEVAEPPADAEVEEEDSIFEKLSEDASEKKESATLLDQLGKFKVKESEEAVPLATAAAAAASQPKAEAEQGAAQEQASPPPPPPPGDASAFEHEPSKETEGAGFLMPVIVVAIAFMVVLAIIWFSQGGNFQQDDWSKRYQTYLDQAQQQLDKKDYRGAILYADSALQNVSEASPEAAQLQEKAQAVRTRATQEREESRDNLLSMAQYEMEDVAGYPGLWRARQYYRQILNDYPDLLDSLLLNHINEKIVESEQKMGEIPEKDRLKQLIGMADVLCEKGESKEAELYFNQAAGYATQLDQEDQLMAAQNKCFAQEGLANKQQGEEGEGEAIASAEGAESPEAEATTRSRSLNPPMTQQEGQSKTEATSSKEALADASKEQSESQADPAASRKAAEATPKTESTEGETASADAPQATSKQVAGSFLSEMQTAAATRGSANARMAGQSEAPKGTEVQRKALADGKSLFNQSQNTASNYQAKRAADYLEAAGPALDGEGYYMLATLYHKGFGVDQDDKKALEYAHLSKKADYTGGYYLYGAYLLETQNRVDSVNGKAALNIAVERNYSPAIQKIREIQSAMVARMRR
jgi:serine/threonine protein phosphatase PrpC